MSPEIISLYKSISALAASQDACGTNRLNDLYGPLRAELYQLLGETFVDQNETALAAAVN